MITLAVITTIMSKVGRDHPELVADEKVRRYILLVVEEGRKLPDRTDCTECTKRTIAPCDVDVH